MMDRKKGGWRREGMVEGKVLGWRMQQMVERKVVEVEEGRTKGEREGRHQDDEERSDGG